MATPHSTLVGDNLHQNVGDSRTGRAWTLDAGTADALLIENSNGNNLLAIGTSTTPGSTTIVIGNSTDLPQISMLGTTLYIQGPLASSIFQVTTNAGGDVPFNIVTAASAPHSVRLSEAYLQFAELGTGDPTAVANAGLLYTKDNAAVTDLYYRDSAGTVTQLTGAGAPGTGDVVGPASATDDAVCTFDGTTGKLIQNSLASVSSTGNLTLGATSSTVDLGSSIVAGNSSTPGGTSNLRGRVLELRPGISLGNAIPGYLEVYTSQLGASSNSLQTVQRRMSLVGSSTAVSMVLGNTDVTVASSATPTNAAIGGDTSSTAGTAGGSMTIQAGHNTAGSGAGAGGALILQAGSTTGASTGAGGDAYLAAGNSGAGAGGTIRLQTGQTSTPVDRLTIEPNGAVQFAYQGATSMPVWFMERYRYTANVNGTAQDVLTYSVPSGGVTRVEVKTVWRGAAATDCAFIDLTGACYNNGGTTDEVGGTAFSATGTRAGGALTDTVEVRLIADNGTDEIKLQLYKINANNFTVDVFVTVHRTA